MDWWKGALLTFTGISGVSWGVHLWNEGYRQRGETHPITRFLEQFMSDEETDRQKRIEYLQRESLASERRLYAIHQWLPNLRSSSHTAQISENEIMNLPHYKNNNNTKQSEQ